MSTACRRAARIAAVLSTLLVAVPALAIELNLGEISGFFDTTLTWGSSYRLEGRDPSIIGVNNGGEACSLNGDDGNLNWDPGDFYSNSLKATHELQLQ